MKPEKLKRFYQVYHGGKRFGPGVLASTPLDAAIMLAKDGEDHTLGDELKLLHIQWIASAGSFEKYRVTYAYPYFGVSVLQDEIIYIIAAKDYSPPKTGGYGTYSNAPWTCFEDF